MIIYLLLTYTILAQTEHEKPNLLENLFKLF